VVRDDHGGACARDALAADDGQAEQQPGEGADDEAETTIGESVQAAPSSVGTEDTRRLGPPPPVLKDVMPWGNTKDTRSVVRG
jgi:hypothetical protein